MLCPYCYTPFWMLKRNLSCSLYLFIYKDFDLQFHVQIFNLWQWQVISYSSASLYSVCVDVFLVEDVCVFSIISTEFFLVLFLFHLFVVWVFCNKRQWSMLISWSQTFLVQDCQDDTVSHKHVFTAVPQMLTSCSFLAQTQLSVAWGRLYGLEYASS